MKTEHSQNNETPDSAYTRTLNWILSFITGDCQMSSRQKIMLIFSLIAGCLLALLAGWNYMHLATIGLGKRKIIMLVQVILVEWFFISLILFTVISNIHRANRIFWQHFISWSILYSIAYFFLSPGFLYIDSYYWIPRGLEECSRKPWLFGNIRHYMPYLHYQLFLIPHYNFFMVIQYSLVASLIALTAQTIYNYSKSIIPIIVLNTILLISIPFHVVVLALVRETPYAIFTTFTAIFLFILLSKPKDKIYSSPLLFLITITTSVTTILHPQGILLAFIVACIILFNAFQWQYDKFLKNGIMPCVCIISITLASNFILGHKSQPWYKHVVPFQCVACYIYFHPELKDSNPNETYAVMDYFFDLEKYQKNRITPKGHLSPGFASSCLRMNHTWNSPKNETIRFRRVMLRLIKDNPGIFIETRTRFAMNLYGINRPIYFVSRNSQTGITIPDNNMYSNDIFIPCMKKFHIPEKSRYLPIIHNYIYPKQTKYFWACIPHFLVLIMILLLNYYIPKSACVTLLYFGYSCVVFLMVPSESWLYVICPFLGALFVLPLAIAEFYERYIILQNNRYGDITS
ncbi:MAG: hypothetical protein LBE12_20120 [Planctomycetaceae bacterium]|jgi:hypothetical protein|nr:hypothetical protein [Planctomycetaceae bacterium]